MTSEIAAQAGAHATAADRLRDIEAVTDAALSRLDEQALLNALLERVKEILEADTAAVLLLDRSSNRLEAYAAIGIEDEVVQGVRVPLGVGFAGRVAASRSPVILNHVDNSTVHNPLLIDRGIKSLLGVPLLVGGRVTGVLHVGSLTGRPFGPDDANLLQLAADRAALAVQSMMAHDDAIAAVAMQRSLVPSDLPRVPGMNLAARYVAGTGVVGGDWYDVFTLPDGRLGVVVGDVAGSGVQAAVIMGRMRSTLRAYVLEIDDPATALRKLDRKIQYFEPDAMATVLYGVYSPETGQFRVSSAGHLPPVLATRTAAGAAGIAELLPVHPDPPIGVARDAERTTGVYTIPPGGLLCCYTDGLVERRDKALDYGIGILTATLADLIGQVAASDQTLAPVAEAACAAVMRALVGRSSAADDISLLAIHRQPRAA